MALVEFFAPLCGAIVMLIVGLVLMVPVVSVKQYWLGSISGILATFSGFYVTKLINPEIGWISVTFLTLNALSGGLKTRNIFYFLGSTSMSGFIVYEIFFKQ